MLWGSRFNEKIDDSALEFSSSLSFDINLIKEDILVSKAHTEMLAYVGLIEEDESGRSRNDQVATELRLWIKNSSGVIISTISYHQKKLIELAASHTETIRPGYTHLQRAQPVSLGFHLLAYVEMLERDKKRFKFVYDESNVSPLGSGALAGSTLPLNNEITAEKLNFSNSNNNALDAVSDRDFALDFLNACSIGIMHLSRFSEELILWSSAEWKFI
ncbi:MAG: lyase family protein, partial [Ignavibacteriaceae bacterium]